MRSFLVDGIDAGSIGEAVESVLEEAESASFHDIGRREIIADERSSHIIIESSYQSGFASCYDHIPPYIEPLDITQLRSL